jgi:hypothetical protein
MYFLGLESFDCLRGHLHLSLIATVQLLHQVSSLQRSVYIYMRPVITLLSTVDYCILFRQHGCAIFLGG